MASNYPTSFDTDANLFLVHDGLRLRLAEDYQPGDTSITVDPDPDIFNNFPSSGLITLTDQCSDIEVRAISFSYSSKGDNTFEGLTLLDGFTDVGKSKRITNVTQNVMAEHHNQLKDALIAIENFVGVKGEVATTALSGTMEARINFLRKLVLQPKSWFTVNKKIGIVPLCVTFTDFSTRQPDLWIWDFGDGTTTTISRTAAVQTGTISKCYFAPALYSPKLTVSNAYGSNSITIDDLITARVEAPDASTIDFTPTTSQTYSDGILRARSNQLISILVDSTGEKALDPIAKWEWELNDDMAHDESEETTASYSIGGLYDVKLKAVTELGAYRTTVFEDVIDIIEKFNVWHFIFDSTSSATTKTLYAYEFGLISETYKAANVSSSLSVTRDAGFLTDATNYDQQYREFRRNNGSAPRSLTASGDKGSLSVFWSEGASGTSTNHPIRFKEFNGFNNTWTTPVLENGTDTFNRQWNWLALDSGTYVYFILGSPGPDAFAGSPTNQTFKSLAMLDYEMEDIIFTSANYLNGADELMTNVGEDTAGNFSVYRGTWKDSSGYFVRNDGTGVFFRFKSFYKTEGTVASPFQTIRKLTDMPGATKFEGQMIALTNGIYFFNNSGEVMLYDPVTNTWGAGGPGVSSPDFTKLQDSDVVGHDSTYNTLVATSDQSTKAYLFFDYSTKAQMKFNETDLTFSSLPVRPSGEQFTASTY